MNLIKYGDVIFTITLLILVILAFLFELAGETVPGFHTISWWAHRDKRLRIAILVLAAGLVVFLGFHFAGNRIYR